MLIAAIVLLIAVLAALGYANFIEPSRIKIVHYALEQKTLKLTKRPKTKEIPAPSGERLLFFSDLHAGPFFSATRLKRVAKAIHDAKPSLILCGGDLITEQSDIQDESFHQLLVDFFGKLMDTAPVVAVYGNHDVEALANGDFVDRLYQETGVTVLRNALFDTGCSLPIYGTDEGFWGEPEPAPDDFRGIVLCHQPDLVPELIKDTKNVLALSGHTHRGQVTFFGMPIVRVPLGKVYTYGEYTLTPEQTLIVTGGIGMVHLPFRFGAPPELLIFDLD